MHHPPILPGTAHSPTAVFYQHTHPPPLQRNLFHLYKFFIPHSNRRQGLHRGREYRNCKNTQRHRTKNPSVLLPHTLTPPSSSSPSPPISSHPLHPNPSNRKQKNKENQKNRK